MLFLELALIAILLALIAILNAVGEPPEFRPSGGQMNPGHDNGGGTQGYYV
jgi:hypothetical protein